MFATPRVLSFASTTVLALALGQGTAVAQQPVPVPAQAAPTPAAAAPVGPADAAPATADDPQAQMDAMRARHHAMCDKMMTMTPQERQAMRETHWQEMRARAAEHGVELPQTPPWVAAEQRRKAAQAQFEKYRKTIETLTPEQLEAARALFGFGAPQAPGPDWQMPPLPPQRPMPHGGYGYGYGPQGGNPGYGDPGYGYGAYQGGPQPMPYDDEGGLEETAPPTQPQPQTQPN